MIRDQGPDHQHRNSFNHRLALSGAAAESLDPAIIAHPSEQAFQYLAAKRCCQPVALGDVPDPADDGFPGEEYGRENGQAAQDEQECQGHDKAGQSGFNHDPAVKCADAHAHNEGEEDRQPHRPAKTDRQQRDRHAEKPIIDPTDRSNSPAIIKRQAPTAIIMNWADTIDQFITPAGENMPLSRAVRKRRQNQDCADNTPQFRADHGFAKPRHLFDALVRCRGFFSAVGSVVDISIPRIAGCRAGGSTVCRRPISSWTSDIRQSTSRPAQARQR